MVDKIDRAQELEQLDRDGALQAHLARQAVEAGNGICLDCGEPIDSRRLAVNPGAVRCTECQSSEELRESRHRRAA